MPGIWYGCILPGEVPGGSPRREALDRFCTYIMRLRLQSEKPGFYFKGLSIPEIPALGYMSNQDSYL